MLKDIRPAITLLLALTVVTGLAYPLAVTGLAQLLFPTQAAGSLVQRDGTPICSASSQLSGIRSQVGVVRSDDL